MLYTFSACNFSTTAPPSLWSQISTLLSATFKSVNLVIGMSYISTTTSSLTMSISSGTPCQAIISTQWLTIAYTSYMFSLSRGNQSGKLENI